MDTLTHKEWNSILNAVNESRLRDALDEVDQAFKRRLADLDGFIDPGGVSDPIDGCGCGKGRASIHVEAVDGRAEVDMLCQACNVSIRVRGAYDDSRVAVANRCIREWNMRARNMPKPGPADEEGG